MYRKKSRGWYKHKDFILIDLICLFLSLLIAHLIRNGSVQSLFRAGIYRNDKLRNIGGFISDHYF